MRKAIANVIHAATGKWPYIFTNLIVNMPEIGKPGPCLMCGTGTDRFRVDNLEGRGTWFCRQCDPQAGDGLALVKNVLGLSTVDAAKEVARVLGLEFGSISSEVRVKALSCKEVRKSSVSEQKKKLKKRAESRANKLCEQAHLGESTYLKSKGLDCLVTVLAQEQAISIGGVDFRAGDILLPILNSENKIVNAQLINGIGEKRFLPSGRKSGCFHVIEGSNELIAVTEGYATALTVHQATKATTYVAFDCGNLKYTARQAKEKHPKAKIIICGDNDSHTDGNPGKTKAEDAAKVIGALTKTPSSHGDWNDFFQKHGLEKTEKKLLLEQKLTNQDDQFLRIKNRVVEAEAMDVLLRLNQQYAHVVVGGRHRVMVWKPDAIDGEKASYESPLDFQNYFLHKPDIAGMNQGKAWLNWAGKAFYPNGIGYYPDTESLPKHCYNLFRGWGVEPVINSGLDSDPDLAIIKTHLKDIICHGDEEAYYYFIRWLAQMLQYPADKPPVAVLMKSVEGSGKGTLFELLKAMLGANAYLVNGNGQLVGRFNSTIDGRLVVFGDEVDFTDPRHSDKLKSLISERMQSIERKGLEPEAVRVLARFMFTGNHDHLIKAGTNERRWLVLEPSPAKQDDSSYWENLYTAIRGNAPAKLLHYLLNLDLADFNVRRPPLTQGFIDQKLASLKIQEEWIYEELSSESPFGGRTTITASEAVNRFIEFALLNGDQKTKPQARSLVGKIMGAAGLTVVGRSDRGRGVRYYDIPTIHNMREAFAGYLKHKPDEIF